MSISDMIDISIILLGKLLLLVFVEGLPNLYDIFAAYIWSWTSHSQQIEAEMTFQIYQVVK